jgi:hypothetical protein
MDEFGKVIKSIAQLGADEFIWFDCAVLDGRKQRRWRRPGRPDGAVRAEHAGALPVVLGAAVA